MSGGGGGIPWFLPLNESLYIYIYIYYIVVCVHCKYRTSLYMYSLHKFSTVNSIAYLCLLQCNSMQGLDRDA